MVFKNGKEAAIINASNAAINALYSRQGLLQGPAITELHDSIVIAINAAIRSLIEDIYTDTEFEQDMGLKDG